MRRRVRLLAAAAVAAVVAYGGILPFAAEDAGSLVVVQTLVAEAENGTVRLQAKGLCGVGTTWAEAAADLERNVPGKLFLRQTERIIFCGSAADSLEISYAEQTVPPGAAVYQFDGAAEALSQQELTKLLSAWEKKAEDVPELAQLLDARLTGAAAHTQPLTVEEGEVVVGG